MKQSSNNFNRLVPKGIIHKFRLQISYGILFIKVYRLQDQCLDEWSQDTKL